MNEGGARTLWIRAPPWPKPEPLAHSLVISTACERAMLFGALKSRTSH